MFFPIRTDRRLKRIPWVTYSLIAANAVIFLLTRGQVSASNRYEAFMQRRLVPPLSPTELIHKFPVLGYYLSPQHLHLYQFITYQFLHANWMHIIGNMIFLYVFGCAVEDKLGKVAYFFFYLGAGVIAGIGHCLMSVAPVLGASGAIAGVTGAFLALFPLTNITIVFFFFFIGAFEVPSIVLVLFEIGLNAYSQIAGGGNIAYLAHLFGYTTGFVVAMTLLLTHLLPREPTDLLALIEHRRRRATFRRMAQSGYQPWQGNASGGKLSKPPGPDSPQQTQLMHDRHAIATALAQHDLPAAARQYRQLLARDPQQVMSEQAQLDLANQLMSESAYQDAAHAYDLFLQTYGNYSQKEHVQLILGLIYARYLHNPDRARELLNEAVKKLDPDDRQLAEQTLDELD